MYLNSTKSLVSSTLRLERQGAIGKDRSSTVEAVVSRSPVLGPQEKRGKREGEVDVGSIADSGSSM